MREVVLLIILMLSVSCGDDIEVNTMSSYSGCARGRDCTASGMLTMSSDGHGFIGKLELENGTCLNVSLPVEVSRELLGQEPRQMTVVGRIYRYVHEYQTFVLVDGRRIGEGLCGDYYLFVQ
jgi:hypothetical protein